MLRSRFMLPLLLALLLAPAAPAATAQAPPSLTIDGFFAPPFGIAKTDFATIGTSPDSPLAAAVDGDRIYTVGATGSQSSRDVAIAARRLDGTLDTGFSGDGKLTITMNTTSTKADVGTGIVVLPDGALRVLAATDVSATSTASFDVTIIGLTRNGSPDPTFGTVDAAGNRRVVVDVPVAGSAVPAAIAVGPDGRLAITGAAGDGSHDDVFVALREPDGMPVTAFDGDGVLIYNRGIATSVDDRGVDVAFRAGGGLAALIQVDPGASNDATAVLHAFKADGANDPAFSDDGDLPLAVDGGAPDTVAGGLIARNGRLWASGSTKVGADTDAFIARVNADGSDLQSRRFDMRGRLLGATDAAVSRALDLALVPGVPDTLVAVGSVDHQYTGSPDWGAAAFNNLDGNLAQAGYGDIVVQAPGTGGLVSAAAAPGGWLAVAGGYSESNTGDSSFGTARLVIDAEKACDLDVSVAEPAELVFRGSGGAVLTTRVTNAGTRGCAGTLRLAAPYRMTPIGTGEIAPGATFTAAAVPVAYEGPRRADDVLTVTVDAAADANTANNRALAHVVFSYCDLVLRPVGDAGAIPTEGRRRFELSLRNAGTATCDVRVGSKARYRLPRGRTASDELAVAAPPRARPGKRVAVVLRASAAEDVNPADNAATVTPTVVKVGDSDLREWGARGFSGTSRRGAGDLAAERLRPARVDVAVLREGGKRCPWLRSARGGFTTRRPGSGGACDSPRWLRAEATTSWRFELRRRLPPGQYVVMSRVTIGAGFPEARFSASDHNRVAFRVR